MPRLMIRKESIESLTHRAIQCYFGCFFLMMSDIFNTRVKIEKINNLLQVDIDRREQGCAAHYEQYCQHVVTALFNCNNLEQHG